MSTGDDAAFEEFVQARAGALLRSAYLLTADRQAAEDLLQDVLEQMYVRWSRIRASPEAYARQALVNRATNRWRWRRRRPETPLVEGMGAPQPDHADRVASHAAVLGVLRALPARQRAVVVLRYLEDRPEAEIAQLLGCSVGTVKSHSARGLARLRAVLVPVSPDGSIA
ncbi:SigE family RNA polymerase sigma factor [Dactylosporangium sp. CS-047395]|uniref:SigE family RNA polymerase sigma factor n=1 Tax=Dactylosporangium sp. CS-047395 TaxID=3239936 RepID=UPI003D89B59C